MAAWRSQCSVTAVAFCAMTCWSLLAVSTAQRCVVCAYNNAGDGTTDFECVNDPFSHASAQNMTCNMTTHSCVIKAVYRPGYTKLQSADRRCLLTSGLPANGCDSTSTVSHTCYLTCRQDLCNSRDAHLYDYFHGNPGDGGGGGGRMACDTVLLVLMLVSCALSIAGAGLATPM